MYMKHMQMNPIGYSTKAGDVHFCRYGENAV